MKKKVREILSKYRQNQGYTMEHAERELLDLFSVSKPFVIATETTKNIVKGKKYELIEQEYKGCFIIDETGEESYYSLYSINVC